jgi:hypothetical protein
MRRFCALLLPAALLTVTPGPVNPADHHEPPERSAEETVRHLYDLVTFDAGEPPDWNEVRGLFLEEAIIVLRTRLDASTVFSLDGWVDDFVTFSQREDVVAAGFSERIVSTTTMEYGDIAHVLVLYEAHIPGNERKQRGVDSFGLARRPEGWRIVSILNEIPNAERPVPGALQPDGG